MLKKKLVQEISNPTIDEYYEKARQAGASGGKILGAGGGGFLLLFCDPSKREAIKTALSPWREIPFQFENFGSKIIYQE
jgi:D-glycero-alpha-D-manno-heptose-7-phosphate kinase